MNRSMFLFALAAFLLPGVTRGALFVPDLAPGESYHLAFLTDSTFTAITDEMEVYDMFVNDDAAGNRDLAGIEFQAITTFEKENGNAADRIDIEGPVYLLDGTMIAEDSRDLWDGSIAAPFNLTPTGKRVDSLVWTGSGRNGKISNCTNAGTFPCAIGQPLSSLLYAGSSSETDRNWITGVEERWTKQLPFYAVSVELMIPEVMTTGDFNGDAVIDAADIDLLAAAIRDGLTDAQFDLNASGTVDADDHRTMITETIGTYFGDGNLDLEFNSSDLVTTFVFGGYEDALPLNSGWAAGDWNGDGDFTTNDLVFAFSDGGFELGPRQAVSAVPEPSCLALMSLSLVFLKGFRSGRHS